VNWLLDTDVLANPRSVTATRASSPGWSGKRIAVPPAPSVIAQLAYWVRSKQGRQRAALQVWLN